MPLRTILISQLEKQGAERVKQLEPKLDASVYGSKINNLIRSAAYAIFPITYLAQDILNDAFPQTAQGDVLDSNFGTMESLPRKAASAASGMIVAYGTVGETVPLQTQFGYQGAKIETTEIAVIGTRTVDITDISVASNVATVTTPTAHYFPAGGTVTVSVGDVLVDGLVTITGITETTFTYDVDTGLTFTTGPGTATNDSAVIMAQTMDDGLDANIIGSVPITGDYIAFTLQDGLTGASDAETDSEYSQRIIKSRGTIEGVFTKEQVESAALRVPGNTRAWCVTPQDGVTGGTPTVAGYKPQPGETCVYIMRDNDINPIASPQVLAETLQAVVDFGRMPCHTIEEDIHVFSPILTPVDFEIQDLVPDTPAMRAAIENELSAYMEDLVDFEDGLSDKQVIAIIANAGDASGQRPQDFTVNLPIGDVSSASGQLLTYGGTTWA